MKKKYIIAGAGFKGFCDAMELMKNPDYEIEIIEPAPFFGGIAYSRVVNDFYVDKGVHMFDSIPVELGDVVNEIMHGETREIEFVSASSFNGEITEGYSLPDLSSLEPEVKSKIKEELLALAKINGKSDAASLNEVFVNRFGNTAGEIFSSIFENIYSISGAEIEPSGMSHTSLHRLKFLDDESMIELKKDKWLDTVLAARRKSMGKIDDYVSLYPTTGKAMLGWCEMAHAWLKDKGVKIHLGEKIISVKETVSDVLVITDKTEYRADKILWSNDNLGALSKTLELGTHNEGLQHGTPMVFITFFTKAEHIRDFTYVQNFDPDALTYRTASAGLYSNQITNDGISFFTCECPVTINSDYWNNPESMVKAVWDECKSLTVIKENAEMLDVDVIKIPVTFKPAKIGYSEMISKVQNEITEKYNRVILRNPKTFFRREIYLDSLGLVESIES